MFNVQHPSYKFWMYDKIYEGGSIRDDKINSTNNKFY